MESASADEADTVRFAKQLAVDFAKKGGNVGEMFCVFAGLVAAESPDLANRALVAIEATMDRFTRAA